MALQTSGAISLANIQTEFGGSNPISLSEYYGGGTYVPAGANPGIATSGAINMNSFYGGVAATVLTISANVNNYDIGAQAIAAGGDKSTPVILTINAGVTVGSTSSGTAAMYTGTGWSSGTTINITNNGSIVGATGSAGSSGSSSTDTGNGGNGGWVGTSSPSGGSSGGSGGSGSAGTAGTSGGVAFTHSQTANNYLSVIFDTAGTRTGGAGGAGGAGGSGALGGGGGGGGASNCGSYGSAGGGGAGTPGGTRDGSPSGGPTTGGVPPLGGCGVRGGTGGNLASSGAGGTGSGYYGNAGGGAAGSTGSTGASGSAGSTGAVLSGNTGQIS